MVKAQDVEHSSLLFDDQGSDPATPASGFSRVFTKSDGLYVIDDAGSVTGPFAVSTGGAGGYDINKYTGGDIALTGTSMTAVTGPTDLVVAAATGDLLEVGISISPVTNTSASISFDFASIVSASPVNYIGTSSGTPINIPIQHWFIGITETSGCGGTIPYVVQAGDISGGNVTLRLYSRVSGNRSINADASNPLWTWVKNLKQ